MSWRLDILLVYKCHTVYQMQPLEVKYSRAFTNDYFSNRSIILTINWVIG